MLVKSVNVTEIYAISVVAIHGLGGDPYRTWMLNSKLWLRDLLPMELPAARCLTYGYDSVAAFTDPTTRVDDCSRTLLERLRAKRRALITASSRPVVFVCHNLGGLLLKKAFLIASEKTDRYSAILRDTAGVIFLGTPHHGADPLFWERCLQSIAAVSVLRAEQHQITDAIKPKALCLGDICTRFEQGFRDLQIFSIYERLKLRGQRYFVRASLRTSL